jgi:hypothetical protein
VLTGLAEAEFACGNATAATAALAALFKHHPARNAGAAALLNARVLTIAEPDSAEAAFHHAVLTGNGPEPLVRYGNWLQDKGRNADAERLYAQVIKDAEHWPPHTKSLQKEWLRQARDGLNALRSAAAK